MLTVVVVLVVSGALLIGAAWGIWGVLPEGVEGFVVALAGGALMISAVLELIEPATRDAPLWAALVMVLVGAVGFAATDYLVDERWGSDSGAGLLTAITLDGVPENLALGVALIGTGPLQVAALSASIFLSNLPEAAGGAKEMTGDGDLSKGAALALWGGAAVLLSVAALAGRYLLAGVPTEALALIRCFAGGAVAATLATEVFPKAFRQDRHLAGIAAALGLVLALALEALG